MRAVRALDLYQRVFEGRRLRPDEYVIRADEKSQLQALGRRRHERVCPLTPNDFHSTDELAERLLAFGEHYRQIARPFEWAFTRQDLDALLARIDTAQAERQRDRAHLRLAA